jgi:hypothetical protein
MFQIGGDHLYAHSNRLEQLREGVELARLSENRRQALPLVADLTQGFEQISGGS